MPVAYRISKAKHANTEDGLMSGKGAHLYGGHWNTAGNAVVYMSGTLSLAMLEIIVHTSDTNLLNSYVVAKVEFGNDLVQTLKIGDLPEEWDDTSLNSAASDIGDIWLTQSSSCILCVPSALVPSELNYLCNRSHPDFSQVIVNEITPLKFDARFAH